MIMDFDIVDVAKKGYELYGELKKNGELGFCCLTSKNIVLMNMLLQLAKAEKLKLEVKFIVRDKKEG